MNVETRLRSSGTNSAINRSHGLEWFAVVSVQLSVHTQGNSHPESAARAQEVWTHLKTHRTQALCVDKTRFIMLPPGMQCPLLLFKPLQWDVCLIKPN
jgi:hypothetical protein